MMNYETIIIYSSCPTCVKVILHWGACSFLAAVVTLCHLVKSDFKGRGQSANLIFIHRSHFLCVKIFTDQYEVTLLNMFRAHCCDAFAIIWPTSWSLKDRSKNKILFSDPAAVLAADKFYFLPWQLVTIKILCKWPKLLLFVGSKTIFIHTHHSQSDNITAMVLITWKPSLFNRKHKSPKQKQP